MPNTRLITKITVRDGRVTEDTGMVIKSIVMSSTVDTSSTTETIFSANITVGNSC